MAYTPSAVKVVTDSNWVESLSVHKPDIGEQLFETFRDELTLIDIMDWFGYSAPLTAKSYSHFEDVKVNNYITTYIGVAGTITYGAGVGSHATVTIAAADIVSSLYYYPVVGDSVQFIVGSLICAGRVTARDVDGPTPTITIYSFDGNEDWTTSGANPVIPTGTNMIFVGNSFGERTDQPDPRSWLTTEYTNYPQISKYDAVISGSEMTNKTWFEVPAENGIPGGFAYMYNIEQKTYKLQKTERELKMLNGVHNTNTSAAMSGISTVQGMIPFIKSNGGYLQAYTPGTWSLAYHDNVINNLDANGTKATAFIALVGMLLYQEYRDSFLDATKFGGVNYGVFGGKEEIALAMGFESYNTSGYTFHFKRYRIFNDNVLMGAPGFNYKNWGIIIPQGQTQNPQGGGGVPYYRLRPKMLDGVSRDMKWLTGAMAPTNKTTIDELRINYLTEESYEFFGGANWALITA